MNNDSKILIKKYLSSFCKNILPYGIWNFIKKQQRIYSLLKSRKNILLKNNKALKNIHYGKRCFILGTGPSIKNQNLIPLKNEYCISVNLFYLHEQYQTIKPKYHVYSGLCNHPHISPELGLKFYDELNEKLLCNNFFLDLPDFNFIAKNKLLRNQTINYVSFKENLNLLFCDGINLAQDSYKVNNVAQQAILIAIYLGFNEIYLVGLDHDWILEHIEKKTNHFYATSIMEKETKYRYHDQNDFEFIFQESSQIWNKYKKIKRYADNNNIKIINATHGGILDVFPRIKFESLF